MTEELIRFLRLQGIARDWSKHNEHSRNIFSVHGFLHLSVTKSPPTKLYTTLKHGVSIQLTGNFCLEATFLWQLFIVDF